MELAQNFYRSPDQFTTTCVDKPYVPTWVLPLKKTTFQNYADQGSSLVSIRPEGWIKQASGFFSRTSLGLVGILQQVVPLTSSKKLSDSVFKIPLQGKYLSDVSNNKTDYDSQGVGSSLAANQIADNIKRIIPDNLCAEIDLKKIKIDGYSYDVPNFLIHQHLLFL